MKLFQHSSGTMFSFGFDMIKRKPEPRLICWSDPAGDWEILSTNLAGSNRLSFEVCPEFVFERNDKVVAYQHGVCIELINIGPPIVWGVNILRPSE